MSQLQVTGEAKIRDIQGPVVSNSGVITALDGDASQYVRGDGTLADFPTSTGGGSSVSYYLNSSVSQGTIGGVAYRQLGKTPIIGAGTDISISSNGYVASYLTDANDPALLEVPAGNFNCEFYFSVNSNAHNPFVYAEVYKYDGTTFSLIGTSVGVPEYLSNGTTLSPYYFAIPVSQTVLAITDRIAIRIYVNVDGRTVTLHTENGHLCQVVTTFSKGLTSLNNLTRQVQFLATGTSGTDFGISSSVATHTFNLPVASATNTGKLSSTDWSTFNNKQNTITNPITGLGNSGNVAYFDGVSSITSENSFNYDASTNRLGVNTTVPNATIGANAGTDSGYSLLLKNDNANYNGIGFATTSTYGNVIGTEKLGTAPARNLTLLNQSGYISITEVGNLGVNILSPNTGLDIYNGTSAYLWLHTANSGITGTDGVRLALFSNNGANLRNFEGAMSITSEGDFSVITLGAENLRVNSADGSIYQSKVANALLKSVSGVITAAVANTDYQSPISLTTSGSSGAATFSSNILNVPNYTLSGLGGVPTSRTLSINGVSYDLSADRSWTITSDITGSGADGRVAYWNGTNSITSEAGFIYDASTNRLGVNTSVPNATIGADAALNSGYGLLIKTGASNYNGIGIAIDSTYGNTIETAKLGTASARNLTLLNQSGFVSLTESGAFGVGILTPNNGIDIYNSTQSQLWLHNNASGLTATDGVRLALFNNLSANLRNFDGGLSLTAEGDFSIITIGAENLRVNSANGFVGIGNPATLTSLLTVNGSITQSVTSALLKTNASGTIVAAVAGTDYVIPSALSSYVPTSRTLTINGTTFDLSANRSWTISSGVSGTTDYIPRFTSSTTIGNSDISQDATFVTLNSKALSAPRARFNTAYDNASLSVNIFGQTYMDSRTSRLYQTLNLSSISNYMHIYDPYSTINANGGFSIGASTSITLLPSTSIIHFDGVNNRVGIGTTSPSAALSVVGAATFSSSVSATNATFTNTSGGSTTSALRLSNNSASAGSGSRLEFHTTDAVFNAIDGVRTTGGSGGELRFWTMNSSGTLTQNMTITSGGNVGIGNTSNIGKLDINTGANTNIVISNDSTDTAYNIISLNGTRTKGSYAGIAGGGSGDNNLYLNSGSDVVVQTGGSLTARMRITSGGNVGIGMTGYTDTRLTARGVDSSSSNYALTIQNGSPSTIFYIRNDGLINLGTAAYSPFNYDTTGRTPILQSNGHFGYLSSTRESKTNIQQLSDISWLYKLNAVSFNYRKKDDEMNYTEEFNEEKWYGLIADEVEKVNEDLVFYNIKEDGTKQLAGVEYNKIIAALIKSSQEQQAQIEELKELIKNK
jgi:hypothetical protein